MVCSRDYAQTAQTRSLPHSLSLGASSQSCTESDAANILPTDIFAPNTSLTISSLKTGPPLANPWEWNLRLELNEAKFMSEYHAVHNHYSRVTGYLEFDDADIMQSYEYSLLDIGPAIGFQVPIIYREICAPSRKITALERLPALSAEVASEIAIRAKVRKEADLLVAIREAHEKHSERQRRSKRAMRKRVPPCLARPATSHCAEGLEAAILPKPQATTLTQSGCKPSRTEPDQHLGQSGHHAAKVHKRVHVRWAPEPAPTTS